MLIILVTKDKFLETGFITLMGNVNVIMGRDLFTLDNKRDILNNDNFIIFCDEQFIRLMSCIFCGRHFSIISTNKVKSISDIITHIRRGVYCYGDSFCSLSMREMVVLFSHIFHSHSTKYIANKLNISNKTVYSHIYHAMEKKLLCRYSVKYLCYLQNNIKKTSTQCDGKLDSGKVRIKQGCRGSCKKFP